MMSSFQFFLAFPLWLMLSLILHCTSVSQPTTPAPAPPGPTNITKILEKSGQYTVFLRLLLITQAGDQINTQLNNSDQGITVFAPTDNAFSGMKSGALNSLSDQQKTSQFQTVSNPLRTQAGDTAHYKFPLNITTSGNQVNISTGVIDTTVANTIYNDGSLAVYQVDKVLLPMSLFGPPAPTPDPVPKNDDKKSEADDSGGDSGDGSASATANASSVVSFGRNMRGFIASVTEAIAFIVMFCL
ncbi:hypothetical protein R6Q57_003758 [Mikania cordata]